MNLHTATRFQDLLSPTAEPSPYEYAMLLPAASWGDRRRSKARFKLLRALDAKLRTILRPDERVYFLTSGTTASFGEQFFVGWAAVYLNMRALVFTTERVILLQIDSRRRPGALVSQIPYTAIAEVRGTWNGLCKIQLRNGETYKFQRVAKADRTFLTNFLTDVVSSAAATGDREGIQHLCPHCFAHVSDHPAACSSCSGEFKSAKRAFALSLLFPGLGDWYLGHRASPSWKSWALRSSGSDSSSLRWYCRPIRKSVLPTRSVG